MLFLFSVMMLYVVYVVFVFMFVSFFLKMKVSYDYGFVMFMLMFCLMLVLGYCDDEVMDMVYKSIFMIFIGGVMFIFICILIYLVWVGDDFYK